MLPLSLSMPVWIHMRMMLMSIHIHVHTGTRSRIIRIMRRRTLLRHLHRSMRMRRWMTHATSWHLRIHNRRIELRRERSGRSLITVPIPLGIVLLHLLIVPLQILFRQLIVSHLARFRESPPSLPNRLGQILESNFAMGFTVGTALNRFRIPDLQQSFRSGFGFLRCGFGTILVQLQFLLLLLFLFGIHPCRLHGINVFLGFGRIGNFRKDPDALFAEEEVVGGEGTAGHVGGSFAFFLGGWFWFCLGRGLHGHVLMGMHLLVVRMGMCVGVSVWG